MSRRPLIGVTTSEVRRAETIEPTPEGDPRTHEMALGLTYLRAIEQAGGVPVVIPPLRSDAIGPLLDQLGGICLSGGPDLDPSTYGQEPDPMLGPIEPELDLVELAIVRHADERRLPILAICRGTQSLNVARGGTLIQHLPNRAPAGERVEHRQGIRGDEGSHAVRIDAGSALAREMGVTDAGVNSLHHQGIDELGEDLVASAWAPDGTIEALEDPARDYLIGVQWHAEMLVGRPEQQRLFTGFVEAAIRDPQPAAGGAA